MSGLRRCLYLMISVLAGWSLVSGKIYFSLAGCNGDSKELFQNITFKNNRDKVVSLYKNVVGNTLIAMWSMQRSTLTAHINNGYSERLFLDKSGSISIRNLHILDEAIYTLQTHEGGHRDQFIVELFVLVPPTAKCKPKIVRVNNILIAYLGSTDCGKPAASVFWLEHSGISYENNVIKLQPGKEAGIYHACLESETLRCTNSKFTDYCTHLEITESTNLSGSSGSSDMAKPTSLGEQTFFIISICILGINAVIVVMAVLCCLFKRKIESNRFIKTRRDSGSTTKDDYKPFLKDGRDRGSKTEGAEEKSKAGRKTATERSLEEYSKGNVNQETNLSENKSQQTDIDECNRDTQSDGNGGEGGTEAGRQSPTEASLQEDFKGNVSQKTSRNEYKSHQTDIDEDIQDTKLSGNSVDGKTKAGRQRESETSQEECLRGNVSQQPKYSEDINQQTDIDQNKQERELECNDENRDNGNPKGRKENDEAWNDLYKLGFR